MHVTKKKSEGDKIGQERLKSGEAECAEVKVTQTDRQAEKE